MHSNISFFIPHFGCPHACAFCSQNKISGHDAKPSVSEIKKVCTEQMARIKNPENTEIAFFGGSFTAIPYKDMIEYLECVQEFIGENKFCGIRVSTRPDAIDTKILDVLKKYHVTAIELGAQTMSDRVLLMNERGHLSKDVEEASKLIKQYNIELGLQMMTGLYGSDKNDDIETMKKIANLEPSTVRIYPTVVIEGTKLAEYFKNGLYKMISFDEMSELCSNMIEYFEKRNISVIKCGLHSEKTLESNIVAGYYHPAFREICESLIYRRKMEKIISENNLDAYIFEVGKGCISKAKGQKKSNEKYFIDKNIKIEIKDCGKDKEKYFIRLLK